MEFEKGYRGSYDCPGMFEASVRLASEYELRSGRSCYVIRLFSLLYPLFSGERINQLSYCSTVIAGNGKLKKGPINKREKGWMRGDMSGADVGDESPQSQRSNITIFFSLFKKQSINLQVIIEIGNQEVFPHSTIHTAIRNWFTTKIYIYICVCCVLICFLPITEVAVQPPFRADS